MCYTSSTRELLSRPALDSRFPIQTSILNEALDLMRSLAIMEEPLLNFTQPGLGAESGEFYVPPTTHFIATVEDLTDMLDYALRRDRRYGR